MRSTLTPKQRRFVEEYLIDLNGTAAARRAGYSERRASEIGYQLLQKTTVQEALAAAQQARAGRAQVSADWVIQRLRREATLDTPGASHGARVRALELLGKHLGLFQELPPLDVVLNSLPPAIASGLRAEISRQLAEGGSRPTPRPCAGAATGP